MSTKIYASRAVVANMFGLNISEDRADPFCKVTMPQRFDAEESTDGNIMRFETGSNLATIEITLKGTSKHHAELSAVHAADATATNGAGVGACMIKDNNGTTLIASDACWISKAPDPEFGKMNADRTWTFQCELTASQAIQ